MSDLKSQKCKSKCSWSFSIKRQMKWPNLVPGPRRLDEDEGEDGGELPAREAAAARDLAHGRGGVDVEQHLNQGRITSPPNQSE